MSQYMATMKMTLTVDLEAHTAQSALAVRRALVEYIESAPESIRALLRVAVDLGREAMVEIDLP